MENIQIDKYVVQPGKKGEVNRNKKGVDVIFQQYKADGLFTVLVLSPWGKFESTLT